MKRILLIVISMVVTVTLADSVTLYVDDDNYGKAGLDGLTEQTAYGTIQDAVNAAESGSVIRVLPGIYAKGGATVGGFTNRLYVNSKRLKIVSTGGRTLTTIVGAKDPDTLDDPDRRGNGPKAIRVVRISGASAENQVVIEGFSIVGGAVHEPVTANLNNYGGAVEVEGDDPDYACIVDCEICDNVSSRGTVYQGTLVRCFIHDNFAPDGKGSAAWKSKLLNCIVKRNAEGSTITGCTAINCSFDDNDGKLTSETCRIINSICMRSSNRFTYRSGSIGYWENDYCTNSIFNINWQLWSFRAKINGEGNIIDGPIYQFANPLFDDYRLLPTATAVGHGDADLIATLALADGVDAYKDFYGNAIPTSGAIAAGACQSTFQPTGGAILFTEPVQIDGGKMSYAGDGYAFASTYPEQWLVTPRLREGWHLFGFTIEGLSNNRRFPNMDDTLRMVPPPAGIVITNTVRLTQKAIYVNPVNGRDESLGVEDVRGGEDTPFKTLQAAVNAADQTYNVVYASAGTYDEGGEEAAGHTNRVCIISSYVRLKGAGAGLSIIKGKLDTESSDRGTDGRGSAAMRCAYLGNFSAIQGFTLTDGRCAWNGGSTASARSTRGGGVLCEGTETGCVSAGFILDCVITNCIAVRGASAYLGNMFRCKVTDCVLGQARYVNCHSCIFENSANQQETAVGGGCALYNCTLIGGNGMSAKSQDKQILYNSIDMHGGAANNVWYYENIHYSLLWDCTSYTTTDRYVYADPLFIDEANGDYRVPSFSPAMTAGRVFDNYWKYYSDDFNNNPVIIVDDRVMAGALQNPVQAVSISVDTDYGSVQPSGNIVTVPGQDISLIATDGIRHICGYMVNDVYEDGPAFTYKAPTLTDGYQTRADTIVAVFSTNWYVNANADIGADTNDGFTPTTPKRTLKAAVEADGLMKGDVIHAAPGVYDDGEMEQSYICKNWSYYSSAKCRVVIRDGITVVADEGPQATIIKGHLEATSATIPFGANAIRCANIGNGGVLRGFTLTEGSAAYTSSSGENEGYLGGGVIASMPEDDKVALIADCIISNNWACRGGGGYGGYYVNCKFIGNHVTEDTSAFGRASAVGCFVDDNHGGDCLVRYPFELANCTFTERNYRFQTDAREPNYLYDCVAYGRGIVNCIIMGGTQTDNSRGRFSATNCILASDCSYASDANLVGCRKLSVAEVGFTGDYRLASGSPAIDYGTNCSWLARMDGKDADGNQRVYNSHVDAGAFEYDWRPDYAAMIGPGIAVSFASENVYASEGRVCIPNDGIVVGSWPVKVKGKNTFSTSYSTVGDGTLLGRFCNPEADFNRLDYVSAGQESRSFKATVDGLDFTLSYSGTGYGSPSDFTSKFYGFTVVFR